MASGGPPPAKRPKPACKVLTVLDRTVEPNNTEYVEWDVQKSFAEFQADPRIRIHEGIKCYTGLSVVVNQHIYAELMSTVEPVDLFLRSSQDLEVDEPKAARRQPSQMRVQLVMREEMATLKKQNEATLGLYPASVPPVTFTLSVGNERGTLLLRWSEVGLPNGTGVHGLASGTVLEGSVLKAEGDERDDGEVQLAAATVLCALQFAMGKRKPAFELELFAGEQGELPQLHERLVGDADVIVITLDKDEELLLVPVDAHLDSTSDELQLFLGYLAPPGALKSEYERLINKKIPIVLVRRPIHMHNKPWRVPPSHMHSRVGMHRTSMRRWDASPRTSMQSTSCMIAVQTTSQCRKGI